MKKIEKRNLVCLGGVVILIIVSILLLNNAGNYQFKSLSEGEIEKILKGSPHYRTSDKFYKSNYIFEIVKILWALLVPLFMLFSGLSAKIKTYSYKVCKKEFFAIELYIVIFSVIYYLLNFPISLYGGFIQRRIFNLSHETFFRWFGDSLKYLLIYTFIALLVLWVPYSLIKKYKKHWWLYTGLLSIPFVLCMFYFQTTVMDSWFNDIKPLSNIELKTELNKLTEKAGIGTCPIYEVNMSSKTKQLNAYMTGVGNSKRIVLWDTTINLLSNKEIAYVTAHEIGHYVFSHVNKAVAFSILGIFLVLFIIHKKAPDFISKYKYKIGFGDLKNIASIPLIILIINIFVLFTNPVFNAYSRKIEHDCDKFALELTKDNDSAFSAMTKLGQNSIILKKPSRLYIFWNYDHPPILERLDFIKSYNPQVKK